MSLLKFISGAASCELCGLPLKTAQFDVKIDGHRVTVCANCKSFIKAETASQAVPSSDGDASPVKTENAQSLRELLKWSLIAGLALWLVLDVLI